MHVPTFARDVVEAIGVREHLRVRRVLRFLLEAAVQVAHLHVALFDGLALDGEHDAHRAVHGRVRRTHVERHRIGGQLVVGRGEVLHVADAEHHLLGFRHGSPYTSLGSRRTRGWRRSLG